jgi:hypothetical protein
MNILQPVRHRSTGLAFDVDVAVLSLAFDVDVAVLSPALEKPLINSCNKHSS